MQDKDKTNLSRQYLVYLHVPAVSSVDHFKFKLAGQFTKFLRLQDLCVFADH